MEKLLFKANGHQARVADGTPVDVFSYSGLEGMEPFVSGIGSTGRCYGCGDHLNLQITDDAVTAAQPCPYPDGLTPVITLAVPSGKLLVDDDLRPVYNWDADDVADYNSALGQAQVTEILAKAGCAFSSIGNTCPSLYRTGGDSYVIASPGYDDEDGHPVPPLPWEELAGIITDLWAYSIADYEDWLSRGGDPAGLDGGATIVDVTPGTYQFTSHSGERGFDGHAAGTVIFAHIERITPGNKELPLERTGL